jgi:ATP-dependent DNA helicase RecQ
LWERLRKLRQALARREDVPPYVIFGDATLREMVLYRPRDEDELRLVSGVGAVKLQRYGADFLEALEKHEAEHGRPRALPPLPAGPRRDPAPARVAADAGLSGTVRETLRLFRAGDTPDDIARKRGLKATTIYTHLARCIEERELALEDVVTLSEQEIRSVEHAFQQLPGDAPTALKPVFDAFDGKYDYGLLRCVRAGLGLGG